VELHACGFLSAGIGAFGLLLAPVSEGPGSILEALFASSPDCIIVVDDQGSVEMASGALETMFGYPIEQVLGKPVELLVPEQVRESHQAFRAGYSKKPVSRPMGAGLELHGRRRDGRVFPVDVSLTPVPFEGRVRTAAFVRDATTRRRSEHLMRDVNEVTQQVLAGVEVSGILADVSERARALVGASAAWVVVPDEGANDRLRVTAAAGRSIDDLVGAYLDADTSLSARSMRAGRPVVLADMSVDPAVLIEARQGGFGPGAYLPMSAQDGPIGALVVARDCGEEGFSDSEVAAVEVFASAAAIGITLGAARDALEELHIVGEHERIGRDLHDTVIQRLFALGMGLQGAQRLADPAVSLRIQEAVRAIDEVIREIRETIFDLNRPQGSNLDVRQRVRDVVAEVASHFHFTSRVTFRGPVEAAISDQTLTHLLAVVREALTNVGRHARASKVDVVVEATAASATLSVADDGIGPPEGPSAGHGLANMADRAGNLGGQFRVTGRKPRGTLVQWTAPTRRDGGGEGAV
jgi:PAS domain S-box-containing protein